MQLSNRLKAVAGLVSKGRRVVDVGTDHGYIPIYLMQQGKLCSAFAMDLREGPLERAREHIRQYDLQESIETRLSDGVCALEPGEADSMVVAGMGGALTIHILESGTRQIAQMKECILQPQSEIAEVRKYLWQKEFAIEEENIIWEDGKFYPMMRVIPGIKQVISKDLLEVYALYGPELLKQCHPVLKQFLEKEEVQNQNLCRQLKQKLPRTAKRLEELKMQAVLIKQALAMYD